MGLLQYLWNSDIVLWVIMLIAAYFFATRLSKSIKEYEIVDVDFDVSENPIPPQPPQPIPPPPQPPTLHTQPQKNKKLWKNEERCRQIFEKLFGVKFESVRPDFLKNPVTNRNLELDGFNPTIKTKIGKGLAFERDGEQHIMFIPSLHKNNPKEFEYQLLKDKWKSEICKQRGITLIRIGHEIAYDDLEKYIIMKLKMNGVNIPQNKSHSTLYG